VRAAGEEIFHSVSSFARVFPWCGRLYTSGPGRRQRSIVASNKIKDYCATKTKQNNKKPLFVPCNSSHEHIRKQKEISSAPVHTATRPPIASRLHSCNWSRKLH